MSGNGCFNAVLALLWTKIDRKSTEMHKMSSFMDPTAHVTRFVYSATRILSGSNPGATGAYRAAWNLRLRITLFAPRSRVYYDKC